ncbi:hypothetical protein JCM6882_002208 [Rhodosporidiobolus microsporus]
MPPDPSSKCEKGSTNWFGEGGLERKELDGAHGGRPAESLMGGRRGSGASASGADARVGVASAGVGGGGGAVSHVMGPAGRPVLVQLKTTPSTFAQSPFYPLVSSALESAQVGATSGAPAFSTTTPPLSSAHFATNYSGVAHSRAPNTTTASEVAAQQARDRLLSAASSGRAFVPATASYSSALSSPFLSPSSPAFAAPGSHLASAEILPPGYPPSFTSATFFEDAERYAFSRGTNGGAPFSPELGPFVPMGGSDPSAAPLSSFFTLPPTQRPATLSRLATDGASSRNGTHSPVLQRSDKLSVEEKDRIKADVVQGGAVKRSKAIEIKRPPTAPPAPAALPSASAPSASTSLNPTTASFVPSLPALAASAKFTFSPSVADFKPRSVPTSPPRLQLRKVGSGDSLASSASGGTFEDAQAYATPPGSPPPEDEGEGEGEKPRAEDPGDDRLGEGGEARKRRGTVSIVPYGDSSDEEEGAEEEDAAPAEESEWEDLEDSPCGRRSGAESPLMEDVAPKGEGGKEQRSVEGKADVVSSAPASAIDANPPSSPTLAATSPETSFASATADTSLLTPPKTPLQTEDSPAPGEQTEHDSGVEVEVGVEEEKTARPASPSLPPASLAASAADGPGVQQMLEAEQAKVADGEGQPPAKKARVEKAGEGDIGEGRLASPAFSTFLHASFAASGSFQRSLSPPRISTASSVSSTGTLAGAAVQTPPVYGPLPPTTSGLALSANASAFAPASTNSLALPFRSSSGTTTAHPLFSTMSSSQSFPLSAPTSAPGSFGPPALFSSAPAPAPGSSLGMGLGMGMSGLSPMETMMQTMRENGVLRHKVEKYVRRHVADSEALDRAREDLTTLSGEVDALRRKFGESEARRVDLATAARVGKVDAEELRSAKAAAARAETRFVDAQREWKEERRVAAERARAEREKGEKKWRDERGELEREWRGKVGEAAAEGRRVRAQVEEQVKREVKAAEERVRAQMGEAETGWVGRVKQLKEQVEAEKERARREVEKVRKEGKKEVEALKEAQETALAIDRSDLQHFKNEVESLKSAQRAHSKEKEDFERRLREQEEGWEKKMGEVERRAKEEKKAMASELSLHREALSEIVSLDDALSAAQARITTLENDLAAAAQDIDDLASAYASAREAHRVEAEEARGRVERAEKATAETRRKAAEVLRAKEGEVASLKTRVEGLELRVKVADSGAAVVQKERDAALGRTRRAEEERDEARRGTEDAENERRGVEGLFKIKREALEGQVEQGKVFEAEVAKLRAELNHRTAEYDKLHSESEETVGALLNESKTVSEEKERLSMRVEELEREAAVRPARSSGTLAFLSSGGGGASGSGTSRLFSPPASISGGTVRSFGGQ